jgi:putative membrane protein
MNLRIESSRSAFVALAMSVALMTPLAASAEETVPKSAAAKLTDAHIAAIVLAANTIDVENGDLAIAKSKTRSVRDFASQMIRDHTSVNEKAAALAARLKVVPQESRTSLTLVAGAKTTRDEMRKLSGAAFDRAYVNNEVSYHQAVIDLLDRTLVPGAENKELKALLVSVRPAFVAHLEHAKMIQRSFIK